MKITLSKKACFFIQCTAFLLLVSLISVILYSFDLINTSLFFIMAQINGFILYGFLGLFFCKLIKRRVMLYGLLFSLLISVIFFLYQPFALKEMMLFLSKNLFFLIVILFSKK